MGHPHHRRPHRARCRHRRVDLVRLTRRRAAPLLGLLLALLAGCSPLSRSVDESRLLRSDDYDVVPGLDLPTVVGPSGCGAQALAAILAWDAPDADAQAIADELPWQDLGATPVDLLLEARSRGRTARLARGVWDDLLAAARAGHPALVMIDAGVEVRTFTTRIPSTPLMHWGVVSGAARDGNEVLLAAPRRRHHVVGRDDFMRRWAASDFCTIHVE